MRRDQLSGQGGFVRSNTQLNLSSPPLFLTFYHPLTVEEEGRLRRGAETYTFKLSLTVYVFLFALYVRSYLDVNVTGISLDYNTSGGTYVFLPT